MKDNSWMNMTSGKYWYSANPPFYHLNLNRVSRAKAQDQDTCPEKESVSLCNGTDLETYMNWWVYEEFPYTIRTTSQLSGSRMTRPFHVVASSICDGQVGHKKGGIEDPQLVQCPLEPNQDDNRYGIAQYGRQMGIGFAGYGTPSHAEFGDSTYFMILADTDTELSMSHYIASGAHLINPLNTSEFVFKVNYDTSEEPEKVLLFYGNQVIDLQPEFIGDFAIVYTSANMSDIPDECVPYFFWFESEGGNVERYPEEGSFLTFGLGSCTEDYRESECIEGDCCDTQFELFYPSTTKCAEESGCAAASFCTGSSESCPRQRTKAKGERCGDPNAICQLQGTCDGISKECPKVFKPSTEVCERSSTDCVQDYFCTGTSNECNKTDVLQPGGFICSVGKCSGFDTTCSRKIGSVTVKFTMDTSVSAQELADGIVNASLGGRKEGLLRIEKTDVANGISVTVEWENTQLAQALYDGLKKTGNLGRYGGVTDVSIRDMFEPVSFTSVSGRAELSVTMKLLVVLFVFLFVH